MLPARTPHCPPCFHRLCSAGLQVQGRGSLHAHIVLWLNPEDVAQVASEITCVVPGEVMAEGEACPCRQANCYHMMGPGPHFRPPECPYLHLLLKQVLEKQQHVCRPLNEAGCRLRGTCSGHFPHTQHVQHAPVFDSKINRWRYHCPRDCDRNTVSVIRAEADEACVAG